MIRDYARRTVKAVCCDHTALYAVFCTLLRILSAGFCQSRTPCLSEILSRVYDDNLFQYPTQREIKSKCRACLKRVAQIKGMPRMMEALAEGLAADGRLAALIALMLQNRLVAEFMVGVVGEKYRTLDYSLTRKDMNLFLMRLAEQDENVAGWSEQTVKRIRGVLHRCLTETGYLDDMRTEKLNPVLLPMEMENELRENGLRAFLPAFNILD